MAKTTSPVWSIKAARWRNGGFWKNNPRFIASTKFGETRLVVLAQKNNDKKKSNSWPVSTFLCKTSNFLGLLDVQGRTNSDRFYPSFRVRVPRSCDFSGSLGRKTTVSFREKTRVNVSDGHKRRRVQTPWRPVNSCEFGTEYRLQLLHLSVSPFLSL